MKKKMVVNLTTNDKKSRCKALKIAVAFSGVESASLKGDDKSQIEVTADGVDPVQLTRRLRKGVGHAELVSVSAVGDKKDEKPPEPLPWGSVWYPSPPVYVYIKRCHMLSSNMILAPSCN